ncbi:melanoma-associated antigen B10-like [Echinops telfairi]|uniref:Melanoma-associated antigen B10-like n=1 Tax=Echinops telfairi TaxID=9371 RepID=A0ABM0J3E3_ECHTE|nr:melanoma-associated antigen B10-like [Echinops telfairi]
MPRGQKSKLRAREKRRQTRDENRNKEVPRSAAEAAAAAAENAPSASEEPTQSSPTAGSPSSSQELQSTQGTTTSEAAASATRASGDASSAGEEGPSSEKAFPATENLYKTAVDRKVVMLVHYLLHKYQMKQPVTKCQILRHVLQMYRRSFPEILRRAGEHLELIFGLDIKEVDTIQHTYVLVNKMESSYSEGMGEDIGVPKTGLLMTILGVIFTNGNSASEEKVWQVLHIMGLRAGRNHFIFGEPKKLITKDFVEQMYLEYQQVPNSDPPRYEFLWGPRSYAETTKMKVLEFVAKIHNTTSRAFPCLYEEALKDEEQRAEARMKPKAQYQALTGSVSSHK